MIEKESEWILPKNLKNQEKKSRDLIDEGKVGLDHGGDLGAYYAYKKGIYFDYIIPHAVSDDLRAMKYVVNLKAFLKSKGFSFACKDIYVPNKIFNVFGSITYKKPLNSLMKLITKILLRKKTHPFICFRKKIITPILL